MTVDPATTIQTLFAKIDDTPYGPAERALIDEAVALADETGEDRLAYEARLRLITSAKMTGDTETLLATFAWCVGRNAADPVRFPLSVDDNDLLWFYKWMAGTLAADPMFDRAMITDCLDQMETAYTNAGVGLSGVHQARFWDAFMAGRMDEAGRLLSIVQATPRDDYSHCDACVRSEEAHFRYATGDVDAGLTLLDEMFTERVSCADEPEGCSSASLIPLLRAGRLDDARQHHFRSYRHARVNPDNLRMVSHHLQFLAVTGNTQRGLELLERHLPWLVHDGLNADAHLAALTSFAMLGHAIDSDGHGDQLVRDAPGLSRYLGEHDGPWTVRDLTVACWRAADELAVRFDTRNGNDYQRTQLAAARELVDTRWEVPLGGAAEPPTPHVSVTEPVDAAGWLDRGRSLAAVDDHRAALDALTTAMRLSTDPAERAVIGTGKIRLLVNGGRLTEATTAHDEYVGNLVASGQTVLADAEREHGLLLHGHTQPTDHDRLRRLATDHDDAEVSTRALLAASRAIGEDDPVASDELCRAAHALAESSGLDSLALEAMHGLLISAIRVPRAPEDVLAVAERLLAVETNPGRRIRVLEMQTMTLGTQHELDAALVAADEALALAVGIGSHTGTAHLARLTARVATELGRAEDAVSRWQLALREATLADENTYVERIELAQQLLLVDRAHEAVELLRDLVSELEDKDDGAETLEQLAHCLFALGIAFRRCGEDSEAYNAFLESVQIAHEADALVIAARSGEKLGALLLEHDDDEAVDVLDTALEDARSQDATAIIVDTLHTRGRARCRFGDAAGLSDLDEALGLAAESAPRWMHADITDSIARGLFHLDRVDEAISTALRAADAFVDLRNDVGAGMALLFAGEVLADGQRYDEAVVILADAIPRLVSVQQFHARACLLAGDAYEHLGRHAEAKDVRAEIDG